MARRGLGGFAAVRDGLKRELLESTVVSRARSVLATEAGGTSLQMAERHGQLQALLAMLIERIEAL